MPKLLGLFIQVILALAKILIQYISMQLNGLYTHENYVLMVSLYAAACDMHAQFAAWENGNWIANSRTLAT